MRRLKTTKRFERDLKRIKKRGKQLDKLWAVVEQLLKDEPLEPRHRAHTLSGQARQDPAVARRDTSVSALSRLAHPIAL